MEIERGRSKRTSNSHEEERLQRWNERRRQNLAKAREEWNRIRRERRNETTYQSNPVILEMAERIRPQLNEFAQLGNITGMLRLISPIAIAVLIDLARNSEREKIRKEAARDLAYMAGWKPVERSLSLQANISTMTEKELDALILSGLSRLPDAEKQRFFRSKTTIKRGDSLPGRTIGV